jgi:hypothetical protein
LDPEASGHNGLKEVVGMDYVFYIKGPEIDPKIGEERYRWELRLAGNTSIIMRSNLSFHSRPEARADAEDRREWLSRARIVDEGD